MRQDPLITFVYLSTSSYPKRMDKGVCHGGCRRWCTGRARLDVTLGHSTQSLADKSGGLSTAQVPSKQDSLENSLLMMPQLQVMRCLGGGGSRSLALCSRSVRIPKHYTTAMPITTATPLKLRFYYFFVFY